MKDFLSATERTMAEYFGAMLHEDDGAVEAMPKESVEAAHVLSRSTTSSLQPQAKIQPERPDVETSTLVRQAQPVEDLLKQVAQHTASPLASLTTADTSAEKPVRELPEEIQDWVIEEPAKPAPVIESAPAEPLTIATDPELQGLKNLLAESGLDQLTETIIPPTKVDSPLNDSEFQTLFFEVAGLTLAVPLKQLGGIMQIGRIHKLIGKPSWFKGVMNVRGEKHNVVDTAMWVMPEKYNKKLAEHLNYQYLIMLDSSPWGLAVENIVTAEPLSQEGIKWRTERGKRPWLAGMAIDRMCALLDVEQLISLLDKGLES
ncbi:chemotaxis protein CheW [Corallincola luteus]|nr:chemotaxis protein CheW [Corallincola luteus]